MAVWKEGLPVSRKLVGLVVDANSFNHLFDQNVYRIK
jgi:hypothetical protein